VSGAAKAVKDKVTGSGNESSSAGSNGGRNVSSTSTAEGKEPKTENVTQVQAPANIDNPTLKVAPQPLGISFPNDADRVANESNRRETRRARALAVEQQKKKAEEEKISDEDVQGYREQLEASGTDRATVTRMSDDDIRRRLRKPKELQPEIVVDRRTGVGYQPVSMGDGVPITERKTGSATPGEHPITPDSVGDEVPDSFKPRQEGATDRQMALAPEVEIDPVGAGRRPT
jgi:hypothetical protein